MQTQHCPNDPAPHSYLANGKLQWIIAPSLGGTGRRTVTATSSFATWLRTTGHHWRSKVLRVCEWEVVQTFTLVEVSASLQTQGGALQGPLIPITKHCTRQSFNKHQLVHGDKQRLSAFSMVTHPFSQHGTRTHPQCKCYGQSAW